MIKIYLAVNYLSASKTLQPRLYEVICLSWQLLDDTANVTNWLINSLYNIQTTKGFIWVVGK